MKNVRPNLFLILFALLAGCSLPLGPGTTPSGPLVEGEALVERVEIAILESFPVQVHATLFGSLPDGCTTIGETAVEFEGDSFTITVHTTRPSDASCTEALVPFEQNVSLDVLGLPAGDYTVRAGSASATFNLAIDNVAPDLSEPTAAPSGRIEGRVWHDICAVAEGTGDDPPVPSAGCIEKGDSYTADGVLTPDEPGIEGVEVQLLDESCEGALVGTTFTNADGRFAFDGLAAGTYCALVDPLANPNSSLLIPGEWTSAAPGRALVELAEGQVMAALNFGWDHQFLPLPEDVPTPEPTVEPTATGVPNDPGCTLSAAFVDETYEDDSIVAAGQEFTKTWTLENTGTCRWEKEYHLIFVDGDRMGGDSPIPLPEKVPAGEQVTLSVVLTAPEIAGTYRGDWILEDEDGRQFGLGDEGDETFWVQIKVEGTVVDLNLGTPDWSDDFDSGANWFMLDSDQVKWKIVNEGLRMRAKQAGGGEFWGLSNQPPLGDFYLEAVFKTGDVCVGLDRYGLLVRSPDPNAGYVFDIACNGQFRVYEWDGLHYNQLQGWTTSPAVNTGANATNRVGVWAEGDTLKLYVNNVLIAEFEVDTYNEGRFGLLVGSTNTSNFDVFVKGISYWLLP